MIYVIMGPTCSGKTALANYLIDKFDCEAINYDAFQIYKDMDIGTAKIEKSNPHYQNYHLLDIVTPDKVFSVKEYQELCRKEINALLAKNKNVVLVGGTGLYVRASLYDYVFEDEDVAVDSDLLDLSNETLFTLLQSLDPDSCKKIHINNRKRLLRAISLIKHANKKKSEIINEQKHEPIYNGIRFIFISPNREELYEKINQRVVEMFNKGLVEEVKCLINKYDLSITARQGIGYKEVIQYLNNELSLQECIELISKRTRNYAKRQITFFKNQFPCETYQSIDEAIKHLGGKLC